MKTILLVDDDPNTSHALTLFLTFSFGNKASLYSVCSGEDACSYVEKAEETQTLPDIVLMDIDLGRGINGIESSRRLRDMGYISNGDGITRTIILLSATGSYKNNIQSLLERSKADEFVEKNDPSALEASVARYL